jgi:hypothetical protein
VVVSSYKENGKGLSARKSDVDALVTGVIFRQYLHILNDEFETKNYLLGSQSIMQNCKGKAIPLQALTGPEISRRLRLPDFKTIDT